MNLDATTLVAALLSAGGGAFLLNLVKSWSDMRTGARASQREVVNDLMTWRDDLEEKLRDAAADRDFWQDVSARRAYQLGKLGVTPAVPEPVPPSARRRRTDPAPPPPDRHRRRHDPLPEGES